MCSIRCHAIIVVWSFIVPTILHMEYDTILCYFLTKYLYTFGCMFAKWCSIFPYLSFANQPQHTQKNHHRVLNLVSNFRVSTPFIPHSLYWGRASHTILARSGCN